MTSKPHPKNQGANQDLGMMALFIPNLSTLLTPKRIIKTNSNRLSPVHTEEQAYQTKTISSKNRNTKKCRNFQNFCWHIELKPHSKSPQHWTSKKSPKTWHDYGKKDNGERKQETLDFIENSSISRPKWFV